MEQLKNLASWLCSHPAWAGISGLCAIITLVITLFPFFTHHNNEVTNFSSPVQPEPDKSSCIEDPIQMISPNKELNLSRSSYYLSGCYVDGCYTCQLKITDLVETDISNQYLKGLDWHVGVSLSDTKAGGRTHSTVIRIRSNGRNFDEIRSKSAFKLDEKTHVWLDTLNVCNKEKRK